MRSHAHSLAALPHLFSEVAVCLGVFNDYMKHVPRYHVLLVLKPFKMYAHTHTHTATLEWEQRAQAKTQEDMQTDREKDKQRDICKRPTHARADASGDAKRERGCKETLTSEGLPFPSPHTYACQSLGAGPAPRAAACALLTPHAATHEPPPPAETLKLGLAFPSHARISIHPHPHPPINLGARTETDARHEEDQDGTFCC